MFLWPVCRMVTTWQRSQVSFPRAEETEAEITPCVGSGFVHQLSSSSGLCCTPWAVCNYWSPVTFSACTYSLSARLWICHSTAEISAVILWSEEIYSTEQFPSDWTSRVTIAVSLLWTPVKGTLTSAAPCEWSTGCFGIQQERFHWTDFCSNMETTVIKPLEKYFLLLGTVVSAVQLLWIICMLWETYWDVDLLHKSPFAGKISVHQCLWWADILLWSSISSMVLSPLKHLISVTYTKQFQSSAPQWRVATASGPSSIGAKLSWASAWMLDWGGNRSFISQICFPDLTPINTPVLLLGQGP